MGVSEQFAFPKRNARVGGAGLAVQVREMDSGCLVFLQGDYSAIYAGTTYMCRHDSCFIRAG